MTTTVHVVKRSNLKEKIQKGKIFDRIKNTSNDLSPLIDTSSLTDKVIRGMYEEVTTSEISNLLSETCAYMGMQHPDYLLLAGKFQISDLHKKTSPVFFRCD